MSNNSGITSSEQEVKDALTEAKDMIGQIIAQIGSTGLTKDALRNYLGIVERLLQQEIKEQNRELTRSTMYGRVNEIHKGDAVISRITEEGYKLGFSLEVMQGGQLRGFTVKLNEVDVASVWVD